MSSEYNDLARNLVTVQKKNPRRYRAKNRLFFARFSGGGPLGEYQGGETGKVRFFGTFPLTIRWTVCANMPCA